MGKAVNSGYISEALNYKMDLDAGNVNTAGQSNIGEFATSRCTRHDLSNTNIQGTARGALWSMPSATYLTFTMGNSGQSYTAPTNGYFYIKWYASQASSGAFFHVYNTRRKEDTVLTRSPNGDAEGNWWYTTICPCRGGDSVIVYYGGGATMQLFRFYVSEGCVDSEGNIYYTEGSATPTQQGGQPIGSFIWFFGNYAPDGYLICNGSAVSRTLYSDLFNVIGTRYGAGDGSTTFNVPKLDDARYIRGGTVNDVGGMSERAWEDRSATTSTNGHHGHVIDGVGGHQHSVSVYAAYIGTATSVSGAHSHGCQGNGNHAHTSYYSDVTEPRRIILLPCIKY